MGIVVWSASHRAICWKILWRQLFLIFLLTLLINEVFFLMQKLVSGDIWALAVDCAIGKLLDAFIVTNHKDSLVLRDCAREANYRNLQIIIYDFAKSRLHLLTFHFISCISFSFSVLNFMSCGWFAGLTSRITCFLLLITQPLFQFYSQTILLC